MTRRDFATFLSIALTLTAALALGGCHRRARAPRDQSAAIAATPTLTPMQTLEAAATMALACGTANLAPLESGIVEAAGCSRVREMVAADDAGTAWLAIPSVRTPATRDLSCPSAELRLTAPATRRRTVRGCGRVAHYELVCGTQCSWAIAETGASAVIVTAGGPDAPFVADAAPVVAVEPSAPAAPVAVEAPTAPVAPALDPTPIVRARITEAHAALRRCAWGRYDVRARWTADGTVTYALDAPLAGTSAEACVRDAMGNARVYASADGELTQPVE